MRNRNLPLLGLLIFLGLMPLLLPYVPIAVEALGKGTDDGARNAIREVSPKFEPWSDSLWRPPDATSERILFSVQAMAGVLALYWAISALRKRRAEK